MKLVALPHHPCPAAGLRTLLAALPWPCALLAANGAVLAASAEMREYLDAAGLDQRPHPPARAARGLGPGRIAELVRDGGRQSLRLQPSEGSPKPVRLLFSPLADEPFGGACLVLASAGESHSLDELARMPLENPNPVMGVDRDGRLRYANPASVALLQPWHCRAGELLPDPVRSLAVAAAADRVARQYDAECGARTFELRFQPESDGNAVNIYALDVSARIEAETALKAALADNRQLQARLQAENEYLREAIQDASDADSSVGDSPAMIEVRRRIGQVAATDTTVLVFGETGTGKELIARAVHRHSARGAGPLVKVNCAALPASLIESELFGHERGAFTGASQRRLGRFELARGGTLFLDEIGELPLELQAKLLRVLQEGEFERVGGTRTMAVDARVIAATNRHLEEMVSDGRFREDLYYRLNVFPIRAPALRERPEDLPALVEHFVARHQARARRRIESIDPGCLSRLSGYDWPGNVRELENLVERAMIVCEDGVLRIDVQFAAGARVVRRGGTVRAVEVEMIRRALRDSRGVIEGCRGAARVLGLAPSTLRERMRRYGIERQPAAE